jgi:hypothetical protein
MDKALTCLKCGMFLEADSFETVTTARCPSCRAQREVTVYSAYFEASKPAESGERLIVDTEASCFYHPNKKAHVACHECGRFVCQLCCTELHDDSVCLVCFTALQNSGQEQSLENKRMLYDNMAFHLALFPMLSWPITLITAPTSLYLVFKHWRKGSTSLIRRTRIRYVAALCIALLQITGWIWGISHFW